MALSSSFTCAIYFLILLLSELNVQGAINQNVLKEPTITVVLLARNKEHTLPYFLTLFERLEYPKNRMSLFIRSDHNQDKTVDILEEWLSSNKHRYHSVNAVLDRSTPKLYPSEVKPTQWGDDRFDHLISLKEEALAIARNTWSDYIWFLDVDVFLTKSNILYLMIGEDKAIIAPMLNSLATYSNFWGGMTEDYWYTRTDDYIPILDRKQTGCYSVPMVHSCVLVDLKLVASDNLTFSPKNLSAYDGPHDDIITFAISANLAGLEMHVINYEKYGFIPPPLGENQNLIIDHKQLQSLKLEVLVDLPPLPVSSQLSKYVPALPKKNKAHFDEIYLISLARRPERRERMLLSFDELALNVKVFDAVDGKKLNETYLKELGVKQMDNYKDPWSQRDMTYGEIGCFLSHYYIWVDIVNNGHKKVLLFEDDIRFEPFFLEKMKHLIAEANDLVEWDLIYLGRKKLKSSDEPWVEGAEALVYVDYSYWTLCYVITLEGAQKLLDAQPLKKIIPVDEYLPIMFDKHPEADWKANFPNRNLKAFSASPLLVYPTHYTGEVGYISDTEISPIINEDDEPPASVEPNLDGKGLELDLGLSGLSKDELLQEDGRKQIGD
ncbi:glycosyltransferase 25 family member isoform X2 [Palaemon carinicauda]|uniref:glycosyltransferase 25 family member isoform X2 n=1 Tax=Palaemon carinicauda TaxID=392227 RepID=UPI0035B6131F